MPTAAPDSPERPDIAVIGGTGFYEFVAGGHDVAVDTPYGAPSAPVRVGTVAGRPVAFLPRHGRRHEYPPHRIPYRANLWALRSLGVRQVIAPCAVGGLRTTVKPGDLVLPDQLVDRTTGLREHTYVDEGATHVPFGDPYCDRLAAHLALSAPDAARGGTMVVIEGPRFSTRAESASYAASGWDLVNMTGAPEAPLARELLLCYQPLALVTDMDAGAEGGRSVTEEEVYRLFAENLDRLAGLLTGAVTGLDPAPDCPCSAWARGSRLAYELP